MGLEKYIKQKKKEKNTENIKKEVEVGKGVVGHGPQTVLSGAKDSADDCLAMKCRIRSGADGRLAMRKNQRHVATRSRTMNNLTAQIQSRFRQEGQGAVSARKEERRPRHQIGGGLHVYARWTLGVWLATGRTFEYYSCDTLVSDF